MTEPAIALTVCDKQKLRDLHSEAFRSVRDYDLSEASYRSLFANLTPLETMLRKLADLNGMLFDDTVEGWLTAAAGIGTGPATISSLLALAHEKHEQLSGDVWQSLQNGGTQIQPIAGCIVLSDLNAPTFGDGEKAYTLESALMTRELVTALLQMGVFADDLFVYRGDLLPGMMRKAPYALIEIPRLDKQIAVCDEIGQACFVSDTIRPLSFWTGTSKEGLKATERITALNYDCDGRWLTRVRDRLLGEHVATVDGEAFPKVVVPRASDRGLLDETTLKRWIELYYEKEGKWPYQKSRIVWIKGDSSEWLKLDDEKWQNIEHSIINGLRGLNSLKGLSLAKVREKSGLGISRLSNQRTLNEKMLKCWIEMFHKKEGVWPTNSSNTVWDQDENHHWVSLKTESWHAINLALRQGLRGLPEGSSLARFRDQHGYGVSQRNAGRRLTLEKLAQWVMWFVEKEGKLPILETNSFGRKHKTALGQSFKMRVGLL